MLHTGRVGMPRGETHDVFELAHAQRIGHDAQMPWQETLNLRRGSLADKKTNETRAAHSPLERFSSEWFSE